MYNTLTWHIRSKTLYNCECPWKLILSSAILIFEKEERLDTLPSSSGSRALWGHSNHHNPPWSKQRSHAKPHCWTGKLLIFERALFLTKIYGMTVLLPCGEGGESGSSFLQFDFQETRHTASRDLLVAQEEPATKCCVVDQQATRELGGNKGVDKRSENM